MHTYIHIYTHHVTYTHIHTHIHTYIQWNPYTWLPFAHNRMCANEGGSASSYLQDGQKVMDHLVEFLMFEGTLG